MFPNSEIVIDCFQKWKTEWNHTSLTTSIKQIEDAILFAIAYLRIMLSKLYCQNFQYLQL